MGVVAGPVVGEVFALPLEQLKVGDADNLRGVDREGLGTLAESMARVGQLAPVLVFVEGDRYRLAAGYRRALAMLLFRERFGFRAILAKRVEAEDADLIRLVENFEREDPSTFETCRYLFELSRGLNGRRRTSASEIAQAVGRSTHYVQNLIRFYRVLPEDVRAAWAADRDRRFTFRVLNELARLSSASDEALRVRLTAALGGEPPAKGPQPQRTQRPPTRSRMSHARAARLLGRLEALGESRLKEDDRATVAHHLLRAFAGRDGPGSAEAIVDALIADLGGGDPRSNQR